MTNEKKNITRPHKQEEERIISKIEKLAHFLPKLQSFQLSYYLRGTKHSIKDKRVLAKKIKQITKQIENMPQTFGQSDRGDEAVAELHYYSGDHHWFVTEKDSEKDLGDLQGGQFRAFGLVKDGNTKGYEIGYFSIEELRLLKIDGDPIQLDLNYLPQTLNQIKEIINNAESGQLDDIMPMMHA